MKAFHGLLWDSGFWELLDEIYQSDMFKISEMGDEECAQHKKTGSSPGMIAVKRVEHDTLHQGMEFISCLLSIFCIGSELGRFSSAVIVFLVFSFSGNVRFGPCRRGPRI